MVCVIVCVQIVNTSSSIVQKLYLFYFSSVLVCIIVDMKKSNKKLVGTNLVFWLISILEKSKYKVDKNIVQWKKNRSEEVLMRFITLALSYLNIIKIPTQSCSKSLSNCVISATKYLPQSKKYERKGCFFQEGWRSLNSSELGQWNRSSPSSIISWQGQSELPSPHAKNSSLPWIIILYHKS